MADRTPTPGNPQGGYDMARLRAVIEDARKQGVPDDEIARGLVNHPAVGPKIVAAGKRGEPSSAALALVSGDYAGYGKAVQKPGENDPTGNTFQNVAAGAGKSLTEMTRGLKQFFGSPFVDDETKQGWANDQKEAERLDAPLMDTGGGMAGKYGTDIAATLAPGAGATTAALRMIPKLEKAAGIANLAGRAGRSVAGSAAGGMATEPFMPSTETLDSAGDYGNRLGGAAVMGMGGDLAARTAGRVIKPLRFSPDPDHLARIKFLEDAAGMNRNTPGNAGRGEFDLAQLTKDPTLIDLKSSLSKLPGFSSAIKQHEGAQLGDFTEAVTARTGYPSRSVGPAWAEGTDTAFRTRQASFENGPPTALDPEYVRSLRGVKAENAVPVSMANVSNDAFGAVDAGIKNARGGRTVLPAKDAMRARSALSQQAHDQFQGGQSIAGGITQGSQEALEDAIKRGFDKGSPGMGDAFDTYRRQMRNYLDVTDAAGRPGGRVEGSALNPKSLETTVRGEGRTAFATGRNEMGKLAEAADQVLLQQAPNSGTPQRSLYSMLLLQGPTALAHAAEQGGIPSLAARMLGGPGLGMHMLYGSGPLGKKHLANGAVGKHSDKLIEELLRYSPGLANTLLSE